MWVPRVVQPKTVLAFPPLAARVRPRVREPRPHAKLRQRQLKGAAFALSRCQGGRILADRQDLVQYVILDTPLRGLDTPRAEYQAR